jgi:putative membrane protein
LTHLTFFELANMPTDEDPRVRLASERTLLAWVRTGLAMMGLGFIVARFGLLLTELRTAESLPPQPTVGWSLWIGIVLLVLGIAVNLLAAWQYAAMVRRIERGEPYRPFRYPLAIGVAGVLAVLGLVMIAYLFVQHQAVAR